MFNFSGLTYSLLSIRHPLTLKHNSPFKNLLKVGFYRLIEILLNISDEEWLLGWLVHPMEKKLLFN